MAWNGNRNNFCLIGSNIVISLLSNYIPDKVRIPAFIVIIASFVTIVDLFMQAYVPSLYENLEFYPLIVVVHRTREGRALQVKIQFFMLVDGAGMGLGFTRLWVFSDHSGKLWAAELFLVINLSKVMESLYSFWHRGISGSWLSYSLINKLKRS